MSTYLLRVSKGSGVAKFDPAEQLIIFYDSVGEEASVYLSVTESKTLELLVDKAGEVVSREGILKYAWASKVVSGGSLNQCIFSLRNTLGDEKLHEAIQTVTRKGYKFNPDFLVPDTLKISTSQPVKEIDLDAHQAELVDPIWVDSANIHTVPADQNLLLRRKPMAPSHGVVQNRLVLWLIGGLLALGLSIFLSEKVLCCLDLFMTEFAPVKEYKLKAGRIIAFGFSAEDPVFKDALSMLDVTDARPVVLVLHRWRSTISASCVNSGHDAFNTRLPISGNSGQIITEFVEFCRW